MKKLLLTLLAGIAVSATVRAQETKKLPSGTSYTVASHGSGRQIALNDVITFNYVQKTSKDSILGASMPGQPVQIQVKPSQNIGDLMDVFVQLSNKDSVVVNVPTDSIFKGNEQQRPPFFPVGSPVKFFIKITNVQTVDEAMAEGKRLMDSLKNVEKTALTAYLASSKLNYTTTPSGLVYGITMPAAGIKPAVGDTVFVNYVGSTLDGKVFDTSIEAEAVKAGLSQPGREYEPIKLAVGQGEVIPGWDEGLLLFNQGSKGFLIIPSELAYAERGGGDVIKPFSTLRFEIELVKVKKPVPVVAKKPAVKKPVTTAKKPAAKPVAKPAATTKPAAAPAKKPVATKKP